MGVPVRDTVKEVKGDGFVRKTIKRDKLWLTQTPQAFSAQLIKEAYQRAYADNIYSTDDAALVERMGINVKMLPGSYDNIKITTEIDLKWGEILLKMRSECNSKTSGMARSGK
jgi:2-C-methyl-D-erythritol 4-phosphate cytidylyltransferase